jgi:hypothetical protein
MRYIGLYSIVVYSSIYGSIVWCYYSVCYYGVYYALYTYYVLWCIQRATVQSINSSSNKLAYAELLAYAICIPIIPLYTYYILCYYIPLYVCV